MSVASPVLAPSEPSSASGRKFIAPFCAAGVLTVALGLAAAIGAIQKGQPAPRAVMMTAVLMAGVMGLAAVAYLLRVRQHAQPSTTGLAFLCASAISLLAFYFFWVSSYVFFPADILIWSEGDFINDIIKFTVGYPMYSPQANNDSINYVPGAQLLTHFIAWIGGKTGSIPFYRGVQLAYAAVAALLATLCCHRLVRLAAPACRAAQSWLWNIFWYAALLLMATNSITNPFAHNLHADALTEVANLAAFYLLLRYIATRSPRVLAAMAAMCTVGFFIRQNALIWLICYAGFLLFWGKSWKRFGLFTASALAIYGAAIAACFALWGEPFYYWVFYMLSKHHPDPLRSFQHLLDAWTYFAALLLGAAALLRGRNWSVLSGAWLACALVLVSQTYTSGIDWMLNHMGPGTLLAGVWFMAGLASVWSDATESPASPTGLNWIRAGVLTATVALMFSGLGVVRIPLKPIPPDAYRYVHDIEHQFEGLPARRVLLDLGDWVYWKENAVVGDRTTSIGDRGYTLAGDFSGILARIANKHYARIMVRGYHSFDFVYDYFLFPKSTGIRKAMQENYREVGTIRAVEGNPYVKNWAQDPYYFGEITILEPR